VEFTDIIEVNTLELTKIPQAEDGTELWKWLKFLSAEREEDLNMIAEKSPQVKKAVVRLMELSNDEKTKMLYESRQKMEWDIQARERATVRATVRVIAKNMLKLNRPIDEIVEVTGLDYEEIKSLQNADSR